MKNYFNLTLFTFLICAGFITGLLNTKIIAQTSVVDTSFNPLLTKDVTSDFTGNIVLQPDGKIIIFGAFLDISGVPTGTYIKRLNTDGTDDTTFNCAVCKTFVVGSVAAQSDGKIFVAGYALNSGKRIFRLNSDGTQDVSFNENLAIPPNASATLQVFAVQPDGKVIVKYALFFGGFTEHDFMRLNTDGSVDTSFTKIVFGPTRNPIAFNRLLLLPNGQLFLGGTAFATTSSSGFIFRYNADGTRDTTFESPTFTEPTNRVFVNDFAVNPDGSLIVSGRFSTVNSLSRIDVVKLLPAGNVDLTFQPENIFDINIFAGNVALLPNGQFLLNTVLDNSVIPPKTNNRIYRFNANGSLDNTYNPPPASLTGIYPGWVLDSSSRVVLLDNFSGIIRFARLNTDGSLDTGFNPTLKQIGKASGLAIQTDGKILFSGDFNRVNGTIKNNLARVNTDGTLDTSFDVGSGFDVAPGLVVLQADGKILVGGDFTTFNGAARNRIARLNADGSLDNTFNTELSSTLYSIVPQASGKILIGGNFATVNGIAQSGIARLNADGSLDTLFSPIFGSPSVRSILLQDDGKILVGGSFSGVNGFNRQNLVRLNSDTSLDTTFNAGNIPVVYQLIRQTDGKFLVLHQVSIERRNSDGSADGSFQSLTFNGTINRMLLQADGSIVVGGAFTSVSNIVRNNFTRLATNGAIDLNFFPAGANASVQSIIGQADGKIIVGGNFFLIGNVERSGIARLTTAPFHRPTAFDYDGDGKADISVFRPSENRWYVLRSSDSGVTQQVFAVNGDVPVPADYDGDGKTDFAIFRPSSGDWWSLYSSSGVQAYAHWGENGNIPLPSDFSGDGKADYIVYRPNDFYWYRLVSSSAAASYTKFGLAGDKPVTGDFDGDGKTDVAIFRPSTGDWWWQSSVDNVQRATHWGISTDLPAPADYDGDGKTDFAVFRPSEGNWYVFNSSNFSYTILHWGIAEDKPVAADYDGDGKADIAVFRPSTGVWYLLRSTAGFTELPFGISGDVPTPNSFVPQSSSRFVKEKLKR
ncbi:MAG: FG-GAP-like repeat-containing protein [Pyrinomonadaceae bacterium]